MRIHVLGICGTFMGGIARLAKQAGYQVSGSDQHVYPPMSDQLAAAGITLHEGYDAAQLDDGVDCVVVGNVMSRGNPVVEAVLNRGLPYTSGPQWLAEHVLQDRWVLAVAGTHGKTSTTSMLAWILDYAGLKPGFLIGGVPSNFGVSARLGEGPFFVVEADEYDTAFFDKRSKFVHYHPRTLVLNNLEFDHADIFDDLDAIMRQFHHLVRTVPSEGRILYNADDRNLEAVISMGCWTPCESFAPGRYGDGWAAELLDPGGRAYAVHLDGRRAAAVTWDRLGRYNVANGLAALAAARHAGVPAEVAARALGDFRGVKRRLEVLGTVRGVTVYDDFAHHPTAVRATLEALRGDIGGARLVAVLEPRSHTMRLGVHRDMLARAFAPADRVYLLQPPSLDWSLDEVASEVPVPSMVEDSVERLAERLAKELRPGDHVVLMSNGSFGGLHQKLMGLLDSGHA